MSGMGSGAPGSTAAATAASRSGGGAAPDLFNSASPWKAAAQGATRGMFVGLVLGTIWGVWQEKKFVLRNCLKEYHLRECPTFLFSIMRRSVTTAPVVATFMGVHSGLRAWHRQGATEMSGSHQQQQHQQQQHQHQQQRAAGTLERELLPGVEAHQPVLAGAAGTAAGAVRSILCETAATVRPLVHLHRTASAGAAAAGLFTLGGLLEAEEERQRQARRQWEEEQQWGPPPPRLAEPGPGR